MTCHIGVAQNYDQQKGRHLCWNDPPSATQQPLLYRVIKSKKMIRRMTGTLVCLLVGLMLVLVQARIGVDENALTQEERLLDRRERGDREPRVRATRNFRRNRDGPKNEMDPTDKVIEVREDEDMKEEEEAVPRYIDAVKFQGPVFPRIERNSDGPNEDMKDEDVPRYFDVTKKHGGFGGFGHMSANAPFVCAEGESKEERRAAAHDKCSTGEQCKADDDPDKVDCWVDCRGTFKGGLDKVCSQLKGNFKCVDFVEGCPGQAIHKPNNIQLEGDEVEPQLMTRDLPHPEPQRNGGPPGGLPIPQLGPGPMKGPGGPP
eukprot:scaffold102133_cov61-Attheya_sp.AAC.4